MADGQEELVLKSDTRTGTGDSSTDLRELTAGLRALEDGLRDADQPDEEQYCQTFCTTLVEYVGQWRGEEDPWPVLEGYSVALLSFARASRYFSSRCDNPPILLEKLSLSCVELLFSITASFPDALWEQFRSSVEMAHSLLQQNGISQLWLLSLVTQERGIWTNTTLQSILNNETPDEEKVCELFSREGPELLQMRVKYLIKENCMDRAVLLAKACADFPQFDGRRIQFKQIYLVCLCTVASQQTLMEELSKVDCQDALEMICNLEAEGDEKGAFTLCSGFLSRQLLQEDTYCAWELTLFWSKLLKRLEPSEQGFLERCRQMSCLAKTVFHLLFFIKVIQSELEKPGLPACIEMCVRALQMESCDGPNKATICKTISCLLPADLEVKRACQLTEFLLEPTVDSYYAVETLYNEPDQKLEDESLPIPNSLRCELLLVFKTQWPFDPEFWDWKALKRHCLGLMGEEASIVCSIDELNDDHPEEQENDESGLHQEFNDVSEHFWEATNELKDIEDQKQKNREMKKLREKGFVSARFRNWQAYMQYCVLCDKEFLGHRIVRHAQTHFKDGLFSCPICLETFETRETLDPHVASHVKLSCKERLAAMKTTKKLANEKVAPGFPQSKGGENQARKAKSKNNCNGDSGSLYNGDAVGSQSEFGNIQSEGREGNICPVPKCRKGFKYFRNLIAHVKDHGDVEEAKRFLEMQSTKIICQYCRRQFVNVNHLNDHLQVHCGTKPYICIQLNCKANFDSNAELLLHRKDHPVFKAKCMFPGCGKIFSEAYRLYDHEAQHYNTFTCKVPDCGKVFHTQSQLDLHEESHESKKVEVQNPQIKSEPLPEQSSLPAAEEGQEDSLGEPLLNSGCALSPASHAANLVKVKHSIESMLNTAGPGPIQAFDPGTHKADPPDPKVQQQMPPLDDQPIQPPSKPPMSHLNEPRAEESLLDVLMSDPILVPSCPVPPACSYQNILEDFQPPACKEVIQGQVQNTVSQAHTLPSYNNANTKYGHNNPNPITQVKAQCQIPYGKNMAPITNTTRNSAPVMPVPQRLPPQVTPFPTNMQVSESRPTQPVHTNNTAPAPEEKEKYKCAYENCSREYMSYRSVTKHMKATHPDFYTQWKLAKKNKKVPVAMNVNRNSVAPSQNQLGQRIPASASQMKNQNGPPPYPAACPSLRYPSISSHLPSSVSQPFPNQMESILDPIVLSQLANSANQSPVSLDPSWNSVPVDSPTLQQRTCHSQATSSNVNARRSNHFSSHVSAVSQGRGTDTQHQGMGYSSLQPQSNFIPPQTNTTQRHTNTSTTGHPNNSSVSVSSYTQQLKSEPVPVLKQNECLVKLERNQDLGLPPENTSVLNTSLIVENSQCSQDDGSSYANDVDLKKVKRSRRTKWPAIIKDGKFICCRCFREFQSPKSLGGHLSKRSHCKAFDEADLTADLPMSFLDLLNSPVNNPLPTSSIHMNSNQPFHIVNKGPLDPKLFPNVTFLHAKDSPSTSNSQQITEIIKQSSANPCPPVGIGQQGFPKQSSANPCKNVEMGQQFSKQSSANPCPTVELGQLGFPKQNLADLSDSIRVGQQVFPKQSSSNPCPPLGIGQQEFPKQISTNPCPLLGIGQQRFPKQTSTNSCPPVAIGQQGFPKQSLTNPCPSLGVGQQGFSKQSSANPCPPVGIGQQGFTKQSTASPCPPLGVGQQGFPKQSSANPCPAVAIGQQGFPKQSAANPCPLLGVGQQGFTKQSSASPCPPVGIGQQGFPLSTPVSYPQEIQNSVIQHTGNIKDSNHHHQVNYSQSCSQPYTDSGLSDPLLSRLLGEDSSSVSFNRIPTDHIGKILQNETLNRMRDIKEESINTSGLSNKGLLAAMASLAQNLVSEKSVKEKLREQILAGDFHKKSSVFQGVDGADLLNSVPSSPTIAVPQQSYNVIQKAPHSDLHNFENAKLSSEHPKTDHVEPGPAQISGTPQVSIDSNINSESTKAPTQNEDEVTEIQKALERLDLDREVEERVQVTTVVPKNNVPVKPPETINTTVDIPCFSCDSDGCGYRAMTRDALFKHLIKLHNYTDDMLNRYRKDQFKLAPFVCQVCSKNFTRNSNLRVHYQSVHNYSNEQITQMRMKQQLIRRPVEGDGSPCPTPNISDLRNAADSQVKKIISDGGQQRHINFNGPNSLKTVEGRIKQECSVQPFGQQPHVGCLDTSRPDIVQKTHLVPSQSQAVNHPSVIRSGPSLVTASNLEQQLNGQYASRTFAPSQAIHGVPSGGLLPTGVPPLAKTPATSAPIGNLSLDKMSKLVKPKLPKPREVPKKAKEKRDTDDVFSPYRPYRCVHQGCVAAFTIQQNLILHYKAIHQSELPKFEPNVDDDEQEEVEDNDSEEEPDISDSDIPEVTEFRCQIKDCSRIFPVVTDLLQHYLQLHKLSLDKAGVMMSGMNLGRFRCDQPNCDVTFTAFWKYVGHIDKEHKNANVSKVEPVEGMYQCEVEGCDCTYSTRSNLLRHTMKKHQDIYKVQLMTSKGIKLGRPRKNPFVSIEKENREVNKSEKKANKKKKRQKRNNYWTKYGKPILKTKEEASAMCTKRFPLQYPCMIKGCEIVASSERNILKHYLQHGLPKEYLEEQRSNYIHCKKLPRSRYKRITSRSDDTDKSEESSVEVSDNEANADAAQSESEFSKPTSEKETTEDADVSDVKLSTDTSSDISVVVKRRRGRPRKTSFSRNKPFSPKRVTRLRSSQSYSVNYADINSDSTSSSATLAQDDPEQNSSLSSFKPMGFEVSFLQFLEQSSQPSAKRKASVMLDTLPHKRPPTLQLKTASVVCSRSNVLKLVEFKNPQKLTCLGNVTFEVHQGFSNVFEHLLKQLHEMRPAVVIYKEGGAKRL